MWGRPLLAISSARYACATQLAAPAAPRRPNRHFQALAAREQQLRSSPASSNSTTTCSRCWAAITSLPQPHQTPLEFSRSAAISAGRRVRGRCMPADQGCSTASVMATGRIDARPAAASGKGRRETRSGNWQKHECEIAEIRRIAAIIRIGNPNDEIPMTRDAQREFASSRTCLSTLRLS